MIFSKKFRFLFLYFRKISIFIFIFSKNFDFLYICFENFGYFSVLSKLFDIFRFFRKKIFQFLFFRKFSMFLIFPKNFDFFSSFFFPKSFDFFYLFENFLLPPRIVWTKWRHRSRSFTITRRPKRSAQTRSMWIRKLNDAEKNYPPQPHECLAAIDAPRRWKYYFRQPPKVFTDNITLTCLKTMKDPSKRMIRWIAVLADYSPIIQHIPGSTNTAADAVSRQVHLHFLNSISFHSNLQHSTIPNGTNERRHITDSNTMR